MQGMQVVVNDKYNEYKLFFIGNIDYSLVAHPSAMEDLENFVRIILMEGLSEGCSTRLKFRVHFNPSRNTR